MKSGYNILWTPNALNELEKTIEYLEENFSEKEIKKLAQKIEKITVLISQNPYIFPKSESQNIYKAVILKFNTMYYRVRNNNVEIISFFSNRQSLIRRKI
ncbi:type II toxin-antitoxin system RelE/ParE family toxin [Sphingobacterium thalpophilum]|uniref:type II toxin-antitoxin system RelE/ParE family toxin n=1 Tax=Sphingobacterium thalpophilum TaxID=259 RepID=UPI00396F6EFF